MPSHIQRGPSVVIPSVRVSQLSHQQLHPHLLVQVGLTLDERYTMGQTLPDLHLI
jgi:hypothetical protein